MQYRLTPHHRCHPEPAAAGESKDPFGLNDVRVSTAKITTMPLTTDQKAALAARVKYAREMGLGDFYRCDPKDIRRLESPHVPKNETGMIPKPAISQVETRHAASQARDALPVLNKSA